MVKHAYFSKKKEERFGSRYYETKNLGVNDIMNSKYVKQVGNRLGTIANHLNDKKVDPKTISPLFDDFVYVGTVGSYIMNKKVGKELMNTSFI